MKTTDFRATNLRATNLMVGDWLYAIDDNGETHLCRVNDLQYDYTNKRDQFCVDFYGTGYKPIWPDVAFKVEPIPITPEILEKNGWKDISTHTLKGCETYKLTYEQNSFDYTITVKLRGYFKLQSYDDRYYTLCEMDYGVKYVHELQHALKLCGIEKEITL